MGEVLVRLKESGVSIGELPVKPSQLAALFNCLGAADPRLLSLVARFKATEASLIRWSPRLLIGYASGSCPTPPANPVTPPARPYKERSHESPLLDPSRPSLSPDLG